MLRIWPALGYGGCAPSLPVGELGGGNEEAGLDLDEVDCEVEECGPQNPKNSRIMDARTTMTPVPGPLVRIKSGYPLLRPSLAREH